MEPFRFEARASCAFAGVGGSGPYFDAPEANWVVPLWRELFAHGVEPPAGGPWLSPCHGREREFTFYGGFAVAEGAPAPDGLLRFEIPAHAYAVGRVRGGSEAITRVYAELPAWSAERGRPVDRSLLWLEVYPERPVLAPEGPFDFEVWLPVRDPA